MVVGRKDRRIGSFAQGVKEGIEGVRGEAQAGADRGQLLAGGGFMAVPELQPAGGIGAARFFRGVDHGQAEETVGGFRQGGHVPVNGVIGLAGNFRIGSPCRNDAHARRPRAPVLEEGLLVLDDVRLRSVHAREVKVHPKAHGGG